MDKRNQALLVAVGLAVWFAAFRNGSTLGDEESSLIDDGLDDMNNMMNGWPTGAAPYRAAIEAASQASGVPVQILAWLLWKESRYNQVIVDGRKISPAGALGIAQFMPDTAKERLGSVAAALDPSKAIPGAARYLASLYKTTGTWREALAAYNWGIGNLTKKGIAAAPRETVDYYTSILSKANTAGSATYE